ncbi:MMB_0454 family protein [Mycoplasmopsis agassizii]|uniref:Uncharacterized protein n=1 Tax=Mycoplasmopsis agassizii TaxID=33922 RepID=A0A1W1WYE9_9BACT|nr:hypothetical protein [Mycoplasmopsis agassizii]PAF55143.1 hypothetical protein CJF60_00455 [Mycoplasmopsis agassizii]PAK21398.1 hypothetical protein CJJ23_01980 [Mycoplasmopsis agassizii]SMC16742.1 hypothetical protein SAMN02745179_00314 [Mycoplasmopsis agassizii]
MNQYLEYKNNNNSLIKINPNAIKQAIKLSALPLDNYEIKTVDVVVSKVLWNCNVFVTIKFKNITNFEKELKHAFRRIDEQVELVIGTKAENISLNII